MNHKDQPYIDGEHFVFPDGRRLPRVRGGENNQGGAPAAFDPGAAPAAQQTANEGAQQQGAQAPAEPGQQAPAGADPRVIEQMQQQMQQFGQVIGPMAEALPALQTFAQQQQAQQQGPPEPSLEEMAAMFFGGQAPPPQQQQQMVPDPYGQGVQYDAYGNPVGYDPYAPQMQQQMQQQGIPPQLAPQFQQFQQQQALQGQPADPSQFVDFLRRVVREEVDPLQQGFGALQQQRQQEAWNALYEEIPAMKDPQQAPQIAQRVAQAAYTFARTDEEAQRFARDPNFARMVHLSSQTEAQAQGETPAGAGDGVTAVESGGGASAPGQEAIDPGDAIVSAGRPAGAPATVFAGGR